MPQLTESLTKHRDKPINIYYKKMPLKEVKKKVQEENHLKIISVFVIIRKNYYYAIAYTVPNKVGKIIREVYI